MKFTMKLIAAAAALVAAGAASAGTAINLPATGSDLVLTVWDNTLQPAGQALPGVALTIDTGITYSQLGVGSAFVTTNHLTDLLSASDTALIASVFGSDASASYGLISAEQLALNNWVYTSAASATLNPSPNNTGLNNAGLTAFTSYLTAVNNAGGAPYQANGQGTAATNGGNFMANQFIPDFLNVRGAALGSNSYLWNSTATHSGVNASKATTIQYAGSGLPAGVTGSYFSLSSAGVLTYTYGGGVSAVPIPAAVWLMGSGLVGLLGVGRRRRAA